MSCPCISNYSYVGTGGVSCGGSAVCSPNPVSDIGSGGAICGGGASVSLPTKVFGEYAGCWHLVETSTGTPGEYRDSTGNNNATGEITTVGGTYPIRTLSPLYSYCQELMDFNWIQAGIDDCLQPGPYSVSFWFSPTGLYLPQRVMFSRGVDNTATAEGCSIAIGYTVTQNTFANVQVVGESGWNTYNLQGATELVLGCWYHCALVFAPGQSITLYIDGAVDASTTIVETELVPSTTFTQFGRQDNGQPFEGFLQEIRVIPVALSQSWIETEFTNLCAKGWSQSSITTPFSFWG